MRTSWSSWEQQRECEQDVPPKGSVSAVMSFKEYKNYQKFSSPVQRTVGSNSVEPYEKYKNEPDSSIPVSVSRLYFP
jgi:hypothetical protein